ncbi:hypothetical protein SNE40_005004 [Patella caerulea]|uniref:EGF-like domain-containing protein n=1 Tax=Patella caerulea TaxID=87958 RepID=A0AAN8KAK7_PATCE
MEYRLHYQTAARLPKVVGVHTIRISDMVPLVVDDLFGVTFEQDTGTITHEVNVNGSLMFSDKLRNLPNNNDVIKIVQRNYFHEMSLAAIIEVDSGVQPATTTTTTTTTTRPPPIVISGQAGFAGMTGATGPPGPPGATGPSGQGVRDVDECPGGCQHQCVNTFMSYYCVCNSGYELESNKRNCRNINECGKNNGGCEHSCQDSNGSFRCSCKNGFSLSSNQKSCEDINECSGNNPCPGTTCVNTNGGYQCVQLKLLNDDSRHLQFDGFVDDIAFASSVHDVASDPEPKPKQQEPKETRLVGKKEPEHTTASDINTVVWMSVLSILVIAAMLINVYECRKRRRRHLNDGNESLDDHLNSSITGSFSRVTAVTSTDL